MATSAAPSAGRTRSSPRQRAAALFRNEAAAATSAVRWSPRTDRAGTGKRGGSGFCRGCSNVNHCCCGDCGDCGGCGCGGSCGRSCGRSHKRSCGRSSGSSFGCSCGRSCGRSCGCGSVLCACSSTHISSGHRSCSGNRGSSGVRCTSGSLRLGVLCSRSSLSMGGKRNWCWYEEKDPVVALDGSTCNDPHVKTSISSSGCCCCPRGCGCNRSGWSSCQGSDDVEGNTGYGSCCDEKS
mmetsp:Transcript_118295/g.341970  ORF Transcript_118295/g.341970 Transcript_118295/m.341970 type:complete len:238 (+) Transcript_118295:519-1232(+)